MMFFMRKSPCLCIAALLCLALIGCTADVRESPEEEQIKIMPEIELVVEVTPNIIDITDVADIISFSVTNLSDETFFGGANSIIEYYDGTNWVKAVYGGMRLRIGIPIESGEKFESSKQLKPCNEIDYDSQDVFAPVWLFGGQLQPGTYRVVYHGRYGEFTIT
jgi:hypothetical protein